MLYDRMCRGGGWNSGNPLVYGVNGEPRVSPTVWALLALQRHAEHPQNRESLDWLECGYESICGPGSLALAHLCLSVYRRATPPVESRLQFFYSTNRFLLSVQVTALAALALSGPRDWLRPRAAQVIGP